MPTGYTDMIDRKPEISTEKWIMTGLARAFGICVTLRDADMNLSEEQIEQKIIEDGKHDCEWHRKKLARANKESTAISKKSLADWEADWTKSEAEKIEHNKKSIIEAQAIKTRHLQVRNDLENILKKDISEITENIAKYGLEQLKIVERETEPYIEEPTTLQNFILETKKYNIRDIKYHTEELSKALDRAEERLEGYRQLKKDIQLPV